MTDKVREYWDSQATRNTTTWDSVGEELEVKAIMDYVKDGMEVLDVGCGTGETLSIFSEARKLKRAVGIDYSPKMIEAAEKRHPELEFFTCDIRFSFPPSQGAWDLVYTQRCLINLPDWKTQSMVIQNLIDLLKPGGKLVLCENSFQALSNINKWRNAVGLPQIEVPWHNCYIDEQRLHLIKGGYSEKPFASTYYFLSRIVNAYVARKELREPHYDSNINELALHLPGSMIPGFSQTKLWIWRKLE